MITDNQRLFVSKLYSTVNYPYYASMNSAKQRCISKKHPAYAWYGGRGIKFLLSLKDVQMLWIRDKAWLLKKPSIDRINPDGHYEYKNCRYIELSVNCSRARRNKNVRSIIV